MILIIKITQQYECDKVKAFIDKDFNAKQKFLHYLFLHPVRVRERRWCELATTSI